MMTSARFTSVLAIVVLAAACTPQQQTQTQSTVQRDTSRARVGVANGALEVKVSAAIASEAGVNAFHISPMARDGIVTLTGKVPNETIHHTVIETVRAVPGVKGIVDQITVR
jgi:osmotically-inducible protein OsmY